MKKQDKKLVGAGIFSAFAASLCCIAPVFAIIAGLGGIATTFSWSEPLRPYLIGISILILGFAWFQVLKKSKEADCDCETDKPSFWQSQKFLTVITVLSLILITFPYYAEELISSNKKIVQEEISDTTIVKLQIEGMTCTGCEVSVNHIAYEIGGVIDATSDYTAGEAVIKFNNSKTSVDSIISAINESGYKVKDYKEVK